MVIYQKEGKAYYGNGQKTESFQLKPSAKATTIVKENKIYVDLDKFKDEIDLYLSLAHEVRHCAQYQAINDVGLVDIATPEMLKIWKKELKEYKGSENEGYETQHGRYCDNPEYLGKYVEYYRNNIHETTIETDKVEAEDEESIFVRGIWQPKSNIIDVME